MTFSSAVSVGMIFKNIPMSIKICTVANLACGVLYLRTPHVVHLNHWTTGILNLFPPTFYYNHIVKREVVWQSDALNLKFSFFLTEHKQGAAIPNSKPLARIELSLVEKTYLLASQAMWTQTYFFPTPSHEHFYQQQRNWCDWPNFCFQHCPSIS